jgi:hypothetical protein
LEEEGMKIGQQAAIFSKHAGRKTVTDEDIRLALKKYSKYRKKKLLKYKKSGKDLDKKVLKLSITPCLMQDIEPDWSIMQTISTTLPDNTTANSFIGAYLSTTTNNFNGYMTAIILAAGDSPLSATDRSRIERFIGLLDSGIDIPLV